MDPEAGVWYFLTISLDQDYTPDSAMTHISERHMTHVTLLRKKVNPGSSISISLVVLRNVRTT